MAIKVIIPAREGSKGLPGKNLKNLCGKPLIDYTILKVLELFESTILTSDSKFFKEQKNMCQKNIKTKGISK